MTIYEKQSGNGRLTVSLLDPSNPDSVKKFDSAYAIYAREFPSTQYDENADFIRYTKEKNGGLDGNLKKYFILLLEVNNGLNCRTIGLSTVNVIYDLPEKHLYGVLEYNVIDKQFRGAGFGRLSLEARIDICRTEAKNSGLGLYGLFAEVKKKAKKPGETSLGKLKEYFSSSGFYRLNFNYFQLPLGQNKQSGPELDFLFRPEMPGSIMCVGNSMHVDSKKILRIIQAYLETFTMQEKGFYYTAPEFEAMKKELENQEFVRLLELK
jgi:GNAT superfamily N-acetyltransferase